MIPRIHLLPPFLSNQIAAGEVVERPSSVVKELVENSLDAKSTRIQVDIEQGGVKLIQVRDDGYGIEKEDLSLAASRHATSKIREVRDLEAIGTLGFRGEALASIASVSRMSITSCVAKASTGWTQSMEGIHALPLAPASHPVGTTVCVRDLFFNTPVRRKFLRSERTEYQYIEDLMRQFILSRFDVGFVLKHQQRFIFNLRPALDETAQQQRIRAVMGADFLKEAIYVEEQGLNMRLHGWLGGVNAGRSSTDRQFFYVNGRMVRDKLILHALRQAYEPILQEGRYASYVLFLELPLSQVDVNVHPTKHEVRFHESRQVHDFLFSTLQRALGTSHSEELAVLTDTLPMEDSQRGRALSLEHKSSLSLGVASNHRQEFLGRTFSEEEPSYWGEPLWMLEGQYLLTANSHSFYVVYVTGAKRHIAYHRLMKALGGAPLKAQPLLIPQTISVSVPESVLITGMKKLNAFMIEVDLLGPSTLVLRKMPGFLQGCHFSDCMTSLLGEHSLQKMAVLMCEHLQYSRHSFEKEEMKRCLRELGEVDLEQQTAYFPSPILKYSGKQLDILFSQPQEVLLLD